MYSVNFCSWKKIIYSIPKFIFTAFLLGYTIYKSVSAWDAWKLSLSLMVQFKLVYSAICCKL